MPKRCAVRGCSRTNADGVSLYSFPKENVELCQEWVQFVRVKRSDFLWPSHTSVICSLHFNASSFEHNIKEVLGIKCRLRLADGAIPTIQMTEKRADGHEGNESSEQKCSEKELESVENEFIAVKGLPDVHEPFECNVEIVVDENACINNENLNAGVTNLLDESSYKCNECGEEFTKKRKFVQHIIGHSNIQPKENHDIKSGISSDSDSAVNSNGTQPCLLGMDAYKCDECGKEFDKQHMLIEHLKSHSNNQNFVTEASQNTSGDELSECIEAEGVLSHKIQHMLGQTGSLPDHLDVQSVHLASEHSDAQSHKCNECGKVFSRRSNLNQHLLKHTGVRPHNCNECGKQFFQRRDLTRHMVTHTGYQPYTCNECGKSFSHKGDLTRHTMNHTGYQPYKCEICGKTFSRRHDSEKHMFVHTDERPYKCVECGKGFSQRSRLAQHMLNHTGERPHKCTECGKAYLSKLSLTRHMPVHAGYKPFDCEECNKAFYRKDDLAKHMLVHTGNLPFSCTECGKMFARKQTLTVHMLTHTGERPHHCSECEATYKYKVDLTNHLKKKHNISIPTKNQRNNELALSYSCDGENNEEESVDDPRGDRKGSYDNLNHHAGDIKEEYSLGHSHVENREEDIVTPHRISKSRDDGIEETANLLVSVPQIKSEKMDWEVSPSETTKAVWSISGLVREEDCKSCVKMEPSVDL